MEHARAHDAAGFDLALVGYSASSAYHAALHTERLDFLVAHRRVRGAEARKIATFDQLTGGRLAVHIITGKTDAEHQAPSRRGRLHRKVAPAKSNGRSLDQASCITSRPLAKLGV